ncbi:hypothetical protein MLD38_028857 [Melastoma candidum]|uniref:Uncharacterized protein n=1 Tax=Melastoma candidum TaxID=119954 RepID=A0ACB9N202_9MYRT|nr:hypothetical protein MLD38_028857 [Melastoma candidum]
MRVVLLLLFLFFSMLVLTSSSRSGFKPGIVVVVEDEAASVGDFIHPQEGDASTNSGGETPFFFEKEAGEEDIGLEGRRMAMQSNDYPGTGANNHHDPRPPTRD